MQFTKNSPLDLLICATCQGAGYVGYRRCPECRGMSLGRLEGDSFLYFGEPLTRYHIRVRKARRILNKFRFVGALIFALGFWGLFFWVIYRQDLWTALVSRSFWFQTEAPIKALLWLGVVSFSYLWYRILVMDPLPAEVVLPKVKRGSVPDLGTVPNWSRLRKLSKKKKIDMADMFTTNARLTLEEAFMVAYKFQNEMVTPEHIFYTLLSSASIAGVFIRLGHTSKR